MSFFISKRVKLPNVVFPVSSSIYKILFMAVGDEGGDGGEGGGG